MSGRRVRLTWYDDPTLHDPARLLQGRYEAYVPDPLKGRDLRLGTEVMGAVSDAEAAIHDLNARAEARMASGGRVDSPARDILANIEAIEPALGEAAPAKPFSTAQIIAIHRKLIECGRNAGIAGEIRTGQNWIGGNDYNPRLADYVPPPPRLPG